MPLKFEDWTRNRTVSTLGTNAGSDQLPFQSWKNFKEAFAPELIDKAVTESPIPVGVCLDPFGGSGTTALACQFLGVRPITAEVNPFLADLIESKLSRYDCDELASDQGKVARDSTEANSTKVQKFLADLPPTFIEPGKSERWLFNSNCAVNLASILLAIENLENEKHGRLFRVILGGMLLDFSNARVSGKGRRYRDSWQRRIPDASKILGIFLDRTRNAIGEIARYQNRPVVDFELVRGDARTSAPTSTRWDLCIFSPPYPNSFDYTDVYNIELWFLGYLKNFEQNRDLRLSTLSSHVQVSRPFLKQSHGSRILVECVNKLVESKKQLWDPRIPDMVEGYFHDLMLVLERVKSGLTMGGECWVVVGDSKYAGIHVSTAEILSELADTQGWKTKSIKPFRSMRASAQQGGSKELAESLVVLT